MILHTGHIRLFRGHGLTNGVSFQQHPLCIIEKITRTWGMDLVFTYSRYAVASPGLQATAPRSPVLRASARDVTPRWLMDRLAELGPTEELAWHSRVECSGAGFHIPMIDFMDRPEWSALCDSSRQLAVDTGLAGDFVCFDTGRSFHGYFVDLIPDHAWWRYLGRLLITNEHACPPLIDSRWVGHALMRGFAALRWSYNTDRYRAAPRFAGSFDTRR
jgi:hypothetical protein